MLTRPNYALTGAYSILKAGFFGLSGLVAAGTFRREIDINARLEALVEKRAAQLSRQACKLQMVGLAMQASETAIAGSPADSRLGRRH